MRNRNLIPFRNKLKEGNVLGVFSKTTDSAFVEVMGLAGMDFVILDMEHGPIGFETLQRHITSAELSGMAAIVRVPSYNSEAIGKSFDLGAAGIQVPSVSTREQAEEVIKAAKFFPKGERGVCRFVRAAGFTSVQRNEYFAQANENLVILQLEGAAGMANFESIIEVEGIDIIFIGPYDLSQSLGVPGEIEHPKVVDAIRNLTVKAKERNVVLGTFCDSKKQRDFWRSLGMKYIAYSVDVGIFMEAVKDIRN
jgi:4-hydroxy-2-oxoheptanedioate aldolase